MRELNKVEDCFGHSTKMAVAWTGVQSMEWLRYDRAAESAVVENGLPSGVIDCLRIGECGYSRLQSTE
jgi:hypothetical protein